MKIIFLILLAVIFFAAVIHGQHRMIYYPRPYDDNLPPLNLGSALEYSTDQGKQVAFYLPPTIKDKAPTRLWLMCGGNASLALDWLDLLRDFPDPEAGFLLLDYPGYGNNQGRPGPDAIIESVETALSTLAVHLKISRDDLQSRLAVMGHSLGAAVVLLYSSHHPVNRIVLVSPFTSLKDMAGQIVGPLLARTLLHDYDNRTRLKEILRRQPLPPITIFHGNHDKVVPVEMGRELATLSPLIDYQEVEKGDHNYILILARDKIVRAMIGLEPPKIFEE